MKTIFWYSIVLFITVVAFSACKKMDSTYKQFIVPGGLTYTGKVNSPVAYAGHNRVKISWLRGADPNITKARIFWNNYSDSVEISIPPTDDTISVVIENLPEQFYSFMIRTYNAKGISSIPVEVLIGSYGEKYQSQLLNRPVNSTVIDIKGKITIQWGNADISNGAVASEIKYTDTLGILRFQKVLVGNLNSVILDYKAGSLYQYRTIYLPPASIDTFYTSYVQSGGFFGLGKPGWKIIAFSSQYDAGVNGVANFIDGTDATRWHTSTSATTKYPHFATIDMGVARTIQQFGVSVTTYTMPLGDNRAPDKIQFLVSTNNINWTDLGVFDFNRFIVGEQLFNLPSYPKARYFKFVGVSGPIAYMVMGEISVYGF